MTSIDCTDVSFNKRRSLQILNKLKVQNKMDTPMLEVRPTRSLDPEMEMKLRLNYTLMECEPTTWKSINLRVVRVFNQRLKFLVRSSKILQSKTLKRFNEFINYPLHSLYFFFGEWERFDLASNCFFYKRFFALKLWICRWKMELK